jgi:hypothetical protein
MTLRHFLRHTLALIALSAVLFTRHGSTNSSNSSSNSNNPNSSNPNNTVNTANTGGQTTVTGILRYAGTEYQRGRVAEAQVNNDNPNERRGTENDEAWSQQPTRYQPNYGELDEHGRATGISITMNDSVRQATRHPTNPTGRPDIPPGYDSNDHQKGHLLGAQFGGSNNDARNFVPLFDRVNSPDMRHYENAVRRHMAANPNEDFTYTVTPVYSNTPPGNPVPTSVTMQLTDSQGNPVPLNDRDGNPHTTVSIPNVQR